jgi:hypothetical protein
MISHDGQRFITSDLEKSKYNHFEKYAKSGNYCVYIEPPRITRSGRQNSYYWAVIVHDLCDFTGSTPEEMHYELKRMFNSEKQQKEIVVRGETMIKVLPPKIKSTAKLSTKEFMDYCESIRRFAAEEYGLAISDPVQSGFKDYGDPKVA